MMYTQNSNSNAVGVLSIGIAILLLAAVTYLLWTTSKEVRIAVVTAVISVGSLIYSQQSTSRRDAEARQFVQKAKIFEEIIATIGSVVQQSKGWENPDDGTDLAKRMFDIQNQLLIWASPTVLKAWEDFKDMEGEQASVFVRMDNLLKALRHDLGHRRDDELGPLGLVKVYVLKADHDKIPK